MADIYREDIATIDLTEPLRREQVGKTFATGDKLGNRVGVRVRRNHVDVDLSGHAATGYFIRSDLQTVVIPGEVEDELAWVDIPQACLTERGPFTLAIKISGGDVTQTVRVLDGSLILTQTDTLIAEAEAIPTLDDIFAQIAAMEQATQEARDATVAATDAKTSIEESFALMKTDIGSMSEAFAIPFEWIDGKFVNQWGDRPDYEGCSIAYVADISPYVGKTIKFQTFAFGDMAYIIADEAWQVLSSGTSGNESANTPDIWEMEIVVPQNAKTLQISYSNKYNTQFLLYEVAKPLWDVSRAASLLVYGKPAANLLDAIRNDPGLLSVFLKVGCIGDSLSSGCCVYKDADGVEKGVDLYQYSWGQYLARMTGNTYYNFSRGGWSTRDWLNGDLGAALAFDGAHTCAAYIIGLGQNDNNQKITVGTSADINLMDYTQNADTFYGYYGEIIQRIQLLQPRAKIFICTDPLVKADSPETNGYNAAIRQIATMFDNVYLLDLYAHGRELYDYDGSNLLSINKRYAHYNAVGYYLCALINATYIDWIMRTNPEEFREVEYIGTDMHYYD